MDAPELLALAKWLARPCVLLKRAGSPDRLAGVWGGQAIVPGPSGPYRHWLSVDARFLPAGLGPGAGVLSVFTNEDDCASGVVAFDPSAKLIPPRANALFAHAGESLPPPDALPPEVYDKYLGLWQSSCPLYTNEAAAVVGGWHFPWPDGDWEDLREIPFVLWTIEDSEPWVEVWKEPDGFKVIQRTT